MSIIISHFWLEDYLGKKLDAKLLPEMLTNVGLEVEEVKYGNILSDKFVVGKVIEVKPHADSKKLNCCKVDIGSDIIDIVCGCSTVKSGIYVIVATVGSVMPNGMEIKAASLRGMPSNGMICSASELALTNESKGIMILPESFSIGTKASDILRTDDIVYDISLTPDRGDCFSIKGIAREAHALQFDGPMQADKILTTEIKKLDVHESADNFVMLKIDDAHKPQNFDWQMRLLTAGYLPQNFIVDFTQYFMHETGQPMHAYDADTLVGTPYLRYANDGEIIKIIGGKEVRLTSDILVVADDSGSIAIAGVIGGEKTAVNEKTQKIILEVASFKKDVIAKSVQILGINTAASDRFSRGVDSNAVHHIIRIAKREFVVEEVIGYLSENKPQTIKLYYSDIVRTLGSIKDIKSILRPLKKLGFSVELLDDYVNIEVPSHRTDLKYSHDIIEELLRIFGHQNWPITDINDLLRVSSHKRDVNIKERLVSFGFSEMITYSFIDPKSLEALKFKQPDHLCLKNPMSSEMSVMRPSILFGLADRLSHNKKRQVDSARVFEYGKVFIDDEEFNELAGIVVGNSNSSWIDKKDDDFYYLKGVIESFLSAYGAVNFIPDSCPSWFHPHATASIDVLGHNVGFIGVLHPKFQSYYKISNAVGFMIKPDKLSLVNDTKHRKISKFPISRKDISFFMDSEIHFQQVIEKINSLDIEDLLDINLFDVYNSDRVSYSLALRFQSKERTLNESEILDHVANIVKTLEDCFKIELRGAL